MGQEQDKKLNQQELDCMVEEIIEWLSVDADRVEIVQLYKFIASGNLEEEYKTENTQTGLEKYIEGFIHRCTILSQIISISRGASFKFLCQFKTNDLEEYLERLSKS